MSPNQQGAPFQGGHLQGGSFQAVPSQGQGAPAQGGAGRGGAGRGGAGHSILFHGGPALGGPLPQVQGQGAPIQVGAGRGVLFQGTQLQGAPLQGDPAQGASPRDQGVSAPVQGRPSGGGTLQQGAPAHGTPVSGQATSRRVRRPRLPYEIRPAGEDMGLGLFATRDIPRGTRIFSEAPIFVVPKDERDAEPSISEKVLTVCDCLVKQGIFGDMDNPMLQLVSHEDLEEDEDVLGACRTFVTDLAFRLGLDRSRIEVNAAFFARLYSVFNYNSFSETRPDGKTDIYLCPVFARINHACSPNCHPQISKVTKQLTVHAIKEIKAGQQIFISYIDSAGAVRTTRDEMLFCTHWVDCECTMCSDASITDELQRELYRMYWGSFYFFHPSRLETDMTDREVRVAESAEEAIKFCERAVEVMKHPSMDLQDETLCCIYQMLSRCYEAIGEIGKAVECAGRNVELAITMGGPDGNDVKDADDRFRSLRQKQGDMRIPV